MKKSYLLTCIGIAMSLLGFSPTTHAQTLPYTCGFEDDAENAQWALVNGSCTNQWYIGTAAKHEGEKGLYISQDGGATSSYNNNQTTTVYAYRDIEITEAGAYTISFDYNVGGEGSGMYAYDYVMAYLAPGSATFTASNSSYVSIPDDYMPLSTERLSEQYDWTTQTAQLPSVEPGSYKLVFMWCNDGSSGDGSAAIDNISISKLTDEPNISVASSLEFPLTAINSSSIKNLTVKNTGGGDLTISNITFSNPSFSLVDPITYPDVIPALTGEKTYRVQFIPSDESEASGTMTIQSNAPDVNISLSGTAYTHIEITDDAPVFENFNTLDANDPNLGLSPWTLKEGYATGGKNTSWSICTQTYVCNGTSLQANDASATATALLISPKLYIPADRNAKISFYMRRAGGTRYPNEGFKVYVNQTNAIYTYDSDGNVVINEDGSVSTLVEPILHATRCADGITLDQMYQMEVNIPSEYSGKEFFVIFEAIQEYGSYNNIDDLKIELLPNTPRLESSTQSIDFGFVKAGATASQEFTLSNVGTDVLEVSFSQKQENSPFSITPSSGSINFNEQQTFTVNFSSSEVGQFSDEIYISTNSNSDTIALKAETYPTTSYYETFDNSTNLPNEWVVVKNGGETSYSVKSGSGVDGTNALTGSIDYWGDESSLDTICSPAVSGTVTFDFKKQYSSSSTFKAYLIDAEGNKSEIDLGANSTNWTPITIENVPEGSRIAFLINESYLDNFMAFTHHEVTKGVQIVRSSLNRPSNFYTLYAGDEKAEDNTLQFSIKNIGTQDIEAGSYHFTTQLVDENGAALEGVSYKTYITNGEDTTLYADNIIPGPALAVNEEKTISGYLHIDCEDPLNKLAFYVKATEVENTQFSQILLGNNINLRPNKGDASLPELDFGMVNKTTTLDYVIKNSSNNGALTISGITVPEGSVFSVNAEFPLVIPSQKSDTIQITFAAQPGNYTSTLTVEHDGTGDTEFAVSGHMLSETTLLESFEGESFPPLLWKVENGLWARSTSTKFQGEASVVLSGYTADKLITPLLHLAAGDSIAFAIKAYQSSGYSTELLYSADGNEWTTLETINTYGSYWSDWTQKAVYMPEDFVEGDYYLAFSSQNTYLDMIYGPQVVYQDHRIDINNFTGEKTGMVNYTQTFTINVACLGTEGETADSYSIALMNGNEQIGSYQVEAMTLGDVKDYTCTWTPRTAGEASIYALLTLNDVVTSTDTIKVDVAEESLIAELLIGDLTTSTSAPNYMHYLYETLYTPAELTGLESGDVIETISIPYYVTGNSAKGYRINVWIGNTQKTALTEEKMSAADIENLTHIGKDIRFELGGSRIEPLYLEMRAETPITYEGGNLSLIISVDSTYYCSGPYFFMKSVETKLTKHFSVDRDNSADYMDTWVNGGYTPRLMQSIMTVKLGLAVEAPVVHGIVTRSDSDEPIEGASVTMTSGEVIYTATTDASGAYSIEVLQPGKSYEMSVTKDQYTAAEGVVVTVEEGDNIEQNFALTIISGIDHTIEAATKIFTDRAGNIRIEAGSPIELVKVYSMSGNLCISENPATESAIINAGGLKGIYIVEVQTAGNVKRAKVRL